MPVLTSALSGYTKAPQDEISGNSKGASDWLIETSRLYSYQSYMFKPNFYMKMAFCDQHLFC